MWQWGIAPHIHSVGPSGNKWSASYLFRFLALPREIAPNNWLTGGWLGPRHGLVTLEKRKSFTPSESNFDTAVTQLVC
jgi:hypothetical protein